MKIRQHEYVEGNIFCIHCGAIAGDATCNERELGAGPRAIPASSVDDFDFIGKRIREIRAEEDAALTAPPAAHRPWTCPPIPIYGKGQP